MTAASTIAIEDLPPHLGRDARLLGLDVGTKTIGMALSDVTRSVATPFDTIGRTKFTADAKTIREVVEKNQVGALVIGFPLNRPAPSPATSPPMSRCPWYFGMRGYRPPRSSVT